MESNESDPIRVLIVDDHAVVRSGLELFLHFYPDLEAVGQASNGIEAIEMCAELRPDVVLMDLKMPEMDGAAATRAIRDQNPGVQVIALTSFREEELVQAALSAGAIGYLLKNVSAEELAAAVREAHAGRPTLAPEAAQVLVHATAQLATCTTRPELTSRERQVLSLLIEGINNPEIARRLDVSRSTVKYHVSSILSKLGTASRTEAVAIALQRGLSPGHVARVHNTPDAG